MANTQRKKCDGSRTSMTYKLKINAKYRTVHKKLHVKQKLTIVTIMKEHNA